MQFLVSPADLFLLKTVVDPNKFTYVTGVLTVPCKQRTRALILHQSEKDTYNIIIGALPASPGHIALTHTVFNSVTHTKLFHTQDFYQSSASDGGNTDHINVPYAISPDVGWHVVPNTSSYIQGKIDGTVSHSFAGDSGDKVVYDITTIHPGGFGGAAGHVVFSISFMESQTVQVPETSTETVSLKWGDSRSFNYDAGTWKLIFDAFDGSHTEFNGVSLTNPFLKLSDQNGSLVISTADPTSLHLAHWPVRRNSLTWHEAHLSEEGHHPLQHCCCFLRLGLERRLFPQCTITPIGSPTNN